MGCFPPEHLREWSGSRGVYINLAVARGGDYIGKDWRNRPRRCIPAGRTSIDVGSIDVGTIICEDLSHEIKVPGKVLLDSQLTQL